MLIFLISWFVLGCMTTALHMQFVKEEKSIIPGLILIWPIIAIMHLAILLARLTDKRSK